LVGDRPLRHDGTRKEWMALTHIQKLESIFVRPTIWKRKPQRLVHFCLVVVVAQGVVVTMMMVVVLSELFFS
jgi:hypothetical protein